VAGGKALFAHLQRALVERLGLRQPPLLVIETGQVVEAHGDVEMAGEQSLFVDLQRAFVEWLGLREPPLRLIEGVYAGG
jgi:hypothetical protein